MVDDVHMVQVHASAARHALRHRNPVKVAKAVCYSGVSQIHDMDTEQGSS
jgi:hypothetical protein